MAKNYKRHTQGQRFKRADFGDMGLRAYQQQQKTIIDGMKLQAAQHKKVRDEYLSGDIDKSRKEKEHREKLKALEDAVWDNKELNEKIRADREIDALKEKAKDYGRSAEFWKDFSTTYAGQYAKAFQDIHGAIDLKYADKAVAELLGPEGKYNQAIHNSAILNNISSAGVINETDKLYLDKKNNGKYKRTEHAKAIDIEQRRSHNLNNILSSKLKGDTEKIVRHFKDSMAERGITLKKDNVRELFQHRALEIMGNLGMDPNSEGGKKFLEHMWEQAGVLENTADELNQAQEDHDNLWNQDDGLIEGLKANKNNPIDFEIYFNHTVKLHQHRYVTDGTTGTAKLEERNVKEAYLAVQELLIDEGIITRSEMHKLNIAFPGQPMSPEIVTDPTKDDRTLMWERHPELEKAASASLLKKEKADNKQKTEKEKVDDAVALTGIQEKVESGEIDPNNEDQIGALIDGHPGKTETLNYLNKLKVFNPKQNGSLGYLVNENINSAYNNNDYLGYKEAMQYLGKEDRQRFNEFTRQLDELNRSGGSNKQIRKEVEKHINADLKLNALNDAEDPSVSSMADVMIQDFYFEYRKIANDESLSGEGKVDKALMAVKEKYKNGEGLYRKENEGVQTKFLAMKGMYDPRKAIDPNKLDEKLVKGWDNLFTELEKTEDLHLLEQDWIDRNLRNIVKGFNVESNATIDHLFETQPIDRGKILSKTEILNKYLAAKGIKTQIPLGSLDKLDAKATNSFINITNYNRMSDENKMRMAVLLEFLDNTPDGKMPFKQDAYTIETDGIRMKYLESQYNNNEL